MSDLSHRKWINYLSSLPPNYAQEPGQPRSETATAKGDADEVIKLKSENAKLRARLAKRRRA